MVNHCVEASGESEDANPVYRLREPWYKTNDVSLSGEILPSYRVRFLTNYAGLSPPFLKGLSFMSGLFIPATKLNYKLQITNYVFF